MPASSNKDDTTSCLIHFRERIQERLTRERVCPAAITSVTTGANLFQIFHNTQCNYKWIKGLMFHWFINDHVHVGKPLGYKRNKTRQDVNKSTNMQIKSMNK